jgi:hypothetical protein
MVAHVRELISRRTDTSAAVEVASPEAKDVEPSPEEAPAPAVKEEPADVEESFMCIDCGQVAKSLAGLKAHERAKHGIQSDEESGPEDADAVSA